MPWSMPARASPPEDNGMPGGGGFGCRRGRSLQCAAMRSLAREPAMPVPIPGGEAELSRSESAGARCGCEPSIIYAAITALALLRASHVVRAPARKILRDQNGDAMAKTMSPLRRPLCSRDGPRLLVKRARSRLLWASLVANVMVAVGVAAVVATGMLACARYVVMPWAEPVALSLLGLRGAWWRGLGIVASAPGGRARFRSTGGWVGFDRVSTALELSSVLETSEMTTRSASYKPLEFGRAVAACRWSWSKSCPGLASATRRCGPGRDAGAGAGARLGRCGARADVGPTSR